MEAVLKWVTPGTLSDPERSCLRPGALDLGPLNGLVHYRLLTSRPVTWRWMLPLSATEIVMITAGIVTGGGFRSFIFLAYCPSLAVFAVVFSSHGLSLAWTTGWVCPRATGNWAGASTG